MNTGIPTPPYHPQALVAWWFSGPLREYNPHVFVGAIAVLLIVGIYYLRLRSRKKNLVLEAASKPVDEEDRAFMQLMAKRKAILDKLVELEDTYQAKGMSTEAFQKQRETYKQHLVQVKLSLRQYVE